MAKLPRVLARIFGSSAPSTAGNQIGQVGSLAANSPTTYTGATLLGSATDIANLTSLSNFASGLGSVVVGSESIPLQDLNGLFFHNTYQLSYLMQQGIAEWETNTVYYTGSLVNDGSGNVYSSLADSNQGNALTNGTYWRLVLSAVASPITRTILTTTSTSPYVPPAGCRAILVKAIGGGGGSGYIACSTTSETSISTGGAAGAYVEKLITSPLTSYDFSVGAGGAGGTSGSNIGANGSNTTFGTSFLTAGGGSGGNSVINATTEQTLNGAGGGLAVGGDININGADALPASILSAGNLGSAFISSGGPSIFGTSPSCGYFLTGGGNYGAGTGPNPGDGAMGGYSLGYVISYIGGTGADGIIIIDEYY